MAKIKSIFFSVKSLIGLDPKANVNSDADLGASIDARAFEQYNSGQVVIHVGGPTGAPTGFSVVYALQHSDDNAAWSQAPGALSSAHADATVTVTAAGIYALPFEPGRLKRYKRVTRAVTITGGTSPTLPNNAILQFGDARRQPV